MSDLPAPDVPEAATTTTSSGLEQAGGEAGRERERDAGRVAAGDGDARRAREALALHRAGRPGELGQAVGPRAGIRRVVEGRPGRLGLEPEVGAAVDDDDLVGQLRGERGRVAVRQREEDDVVAGQRVDGGRLEHAVGERDQVRVDAPEPFTGTAGRRDGADLELRVGEQQPEDLSSGVAARPRHCCPDHDA